jgi:transaldolase
MNNSQKAYALGQAIWYDNIQRALLENGEMARMIQDGEIYGVTSNPSIFNNAIGKTGDYDADLRPLLVSGKPAIEIFEELAVKDIQTACDLFIDLYNASNLGDGYVSLEVNPDLADETEKTLAEAVRLWELVDRPNLMVKIPATPAGVPAIAQAIAAGVNVNVTLIFSQDRYEEVMDAYLTGLENRLSAGQPIDQIASVASFFVSRMDSKVDDRLITLAEQSPDQGADAKELLGRSAIANARLAYQRYLKVFGGERFGQLADKGARKQRPLWASTSTKNPIYPDTLYVDNLIGENTVNTVPPNTLEAFLDHGVIKETVEDDLETQAVVLKKLEVLGISIETVTSELEREGVASFSKAFADLLKTIESRRG